MIENIWPCASHLALSIEPAWLGWVAVFIGPVTLLFGGAAYFKLDNRYETKDDAIEKALRLKNEHEEAVKRLEAADIENAKAIKEVADTFKAAHEAIRVSLGNVRNDMNSGFTNITNTVNAGVLSLTAEVAEMRGRLAGAAGFHNKPDQ